MRGSPLAWSLVQLPLLSTLFVVAAISFNPLNNTILQNCNIDLSKIDYLNCDILTVLSHCYESYKWVSIEDWVCECVCLLKQNIISESRQISKIQNLKAPVLHCRDDNSISVTWSENPENFEPPVNENFVYLTEIHQQGDQSWHPFNVTGRLVSVARNLKPDTAYRFRVHKIRPGFHQISPEGEFIRTFRSLSNQSAESLFPTQEVSRVSPFTFHKNSTASSRIKWKPGQDRTCWYNVIISTVRHDGPIRHKEVYVAETPLEAEITGLSVGVRYNVEVSGLGRNHSHSNTTGNAFCEVFPVNLNLSGPSAPKINVSIIRVVETSGGITRIDIKLTWNPIPGGPPSNITILVQSDISGNFTPTVVNGTEHSVIIRNVLVRKTYNLTVFASSPGGEGEHAQWWDEVGIIEASSEATLILGIFLSIFASCGAVVIFRKFCVNKVLRRDLNGKHSQLDLNPIVRYDEWEIPREKLVIEDEIGRGAFGTVHRAYLSRPTGLIEVAVKKLRPDPTSDDARQFRLEMEIMKGVDKHPNVLSLVGCVTKPERGQPLEQLLIFEYCALGDLQGFLRKSWKRMAEEASSITYVSVDTKCVQYSQLMAYSDSTSRSTCDDDESEEHFVESQPLAVSNQTYGLYLGMEGGVRRQKLDSEFVVTPADLLSFARQVAMGMEFLSACRVVHRDLAARNVLVCADRSVKISDFGLSRDIYEQNVYRKAGTERIPVKWMAIESLMQQIYTTQSDVWSFGILLYEIATLGGSPYPSVSNDALLQLLNSGYRMERPSTCGTELYKLMRECWEANPNKRPNFGNLKRSLDNLLVAAAPHHYIQIDQLFSTTSEENATL